MSERTSGVVVAERFRLEERLGQGGMGEVWRAHHVTLDIPCALKFIHDDHDQDDRARSRFSQEARAAAKLRSPNVVQILDYGVWEEVPYIAMELLEGETLTARLKRLGRLSSSATLAIARDVAHALEKARELSIVHRDLKPDNLFIVHDTGREITKVLDFGVAK
ncbi:MAG: serine/threonine protein kinase, partial [Myxococcales bacterium]|nr:serine/threonine protein kinase [Myxococcales bacterium]